MPKRDLEHIIALYDGEIAFTDSYIGRLMEYLKHLGIYENMMVILTSDHGDEFFEHGCKGHRNNLFDETLKVPLIIKFPSGSASSSLLRKRINQQVSIVDIVPTFLDYLNITPYNILNGRSLLPVIAGDIDAGTEAHSPFESHRFADLHGFMKCVRTNQFKYIHIAHHPKVRKRETRRFSLHRLFDKIRDIHDMKVEEREKTLLFDLQQDATEHHNLAMSDPKLKIEMHHILMNWLSEAKILAGNIGKSDFEYDEDLTEKLRDLGYIQ